MGEILTVFHCLNPDGDVTAGGYAYYKVANASKDAQVTLSRGEQSVKRIKEFNPKKDNFPPC